MPLVLRAMLLALLACWGLPAAALESAPVVSPRATVSLVTDTDAVSPGTPFRVGLRFRLAPGWHTYWRNPGDAGVAPELDLALPPGATAGPIGWPAPQRVAEGPLMTYAYTGEVLLPLTVTPAPATPPRTIAADARWLVCSEICVPEQARLHASICRPATPPPRRRRRCSPPPTDASRARRPGPRRSRRTARCGCGGGAERRHRDRCLVHSGDRRHDRGRRAAQPLSVTGYGRLDAGAQAGAGVQAGRQTLDGVLAVRTAAGRRPTWRSAPRRARRRPSWRCRWPACWASPSSAG